MAEEEHILPAVGGIHRLEVLENLLLAVEVDTQIHLAGQDSLCCHLDLGTACC